MHMDVIVNTHQSVCYCYNMDVNEALQSICQHMDVNTHQSICQHMDVNTYQSVCQHMDVNTHQSVC